MVKAIVCFVLCGFYTQSLLAKPSFAEILNLSHSIVLITTQMENGRNGRGSGVVVSHEYVATNCHVIANAAGANVAKFRQAYAPIAIRADWKHDLCLLKFNDLPLTPVPMRLSQTLQYEENILTIGFPAGTNVPQPSYGEIKGMYPLDDSLIIRANAAFSLGSSGGALFDRAFKLIGITTFKSPGTDGYFYSLPADWIQALIDAPASIEMKTLHTEETPFWALPLDERPYFMQVVIPYQNKAWPTLKTIAQAWTKQDAELADAWYFLGLAEEGLGNMPAAMAHFTQASKLNTRDLDAMLALARVAYQQSDVATLETLKTAVSVIDAQQGEAIAHKIDALTVQH